MYNVAFKNIADGPYKGSYTWTSFESKEAFDIWYTDELRGREEVIEEEISDKRCIELTHLTPLSTHLRIALHKSTNSKTGETNEVILDMQITQLRMFGVI